MVAAVVAHLYRSIINVINLSRLLLVSALVMALGIPAVAAEPPLLRIPKPRSELDTSYSYYTQLLQKVLAKAANGRALPQLVPTLAMEQERAVHELARGNTIDIFWMGANNMRTKALRAIPIPLERGLMGYRQFIIHRSRLADFEQVKTLADLRRFTACQGAQWPDTDILRDANLKVITSTGYENLFRQVAAGRCDYFPRGYHEIKIEMAKRGAEFPELMAYNALILHYPFGIYFFVRRDNEALAQWLEAGLQQMIDEGELALHLQQHPHTSRAFPLTPIIHKRLLYIPNYNLPDFADVHNSRYWFQPADFIGEGSL